MASNNAGPKSKDESDVASFASRFKGNGGGDGDGNSNGTLNIGSDLASGQAGSSKHSMEQDMFRRFMSLRQNIPVGAPPEDPMRVSESCISKAVLSTTIGGVMGATVGIVFGTLGGTPTGAILRPGIPEPPR